MALDILWITPMMKRSCRCCFILLKLLMQLNHLSLLKRNSLRLGNLWRVLPNLDSLDLLVIMLLNCLRYRMGMASRKKYKTMKRDKKIEPAVQTLFFNIPAITEDNKGIHYIDLSQCASLVNRRFYRQGINWAVNSFKWVAAPASYLTNLQISILPQTWVMSNSWEKGFRAWQEMNKKALAEASSIAPKFLDFKIYAEALHHAKGFERNLLPFFSSTTAINYATPGEWVASKYSVPDSGAHAAYDREIIAVGPNYPGGGASGLNAISLIEGYAASRSLPDIRDPNTPDDAADADGTSPENWMVALFNEGTEQDADVIETMLVDNNQAPYPFENGEDPSNPGTTFTDTMYPGGANQLTGLQPHVNIQVAATTAEQTQVYEKYSPGTSVPCGLLRVLSTTDLDTILRIELVPGHHRGYLCEPMTEM